jgi:hypothetical protein
MMELIRNRGSNSNHLLEEIYPKVLGNEIEKGER